MSQNARRLYFYPENFDWPRCISLEVIETSKNNKELLAKVSEGLDVGGIIYEYAVLVVRSSEEYLTDINSRKFVGVALTCIPDSKFDMSKPFDTSWWRGGATSLGSLSRESC